MKPTVTLPSFPSGVENWWWAKTQEKWPQFAEEKQLNLLRQEVVVQSDRFNKGRTFNSASYGARDLSVLAYGNYYFSRTWTASTFASAECLDFTRWIPPKKGPIRILDIGAGTGACALSTAFTLRNYGIPNKIEIKAWDYSGKSLAYAKNLHREHLDLWPDSIFLTERIDLRKTLKSSTRQKYDLILLGFSMNEIMQGNEPLQKLLWLETCISYLKRSGRLIITEPAESEICRNLHKVAGQLVDQEQQLFSLAPYFNGIVCPMTKNETKYFSHEVRSYPPVGTVEKINRPLHLEIGEVKFALSILGCTKPELENHGPKAFRIISPIKKRKGTISFWGMDANGHEKNYEFQRRSISKEQADNLLFLRRGDLLRIRGDYTEGKMNRIRFSGNNEISPVFIPRLKT